MRRVRGKILLAVLALLAAGIYYYVTLPAINIHSSGFWVFLIAVIVILLFLYGVRRVHSLEEMKTSKVMRAGIVVVGLVIVVYLAGSILSSPIVNAKKYQLLLVPETGDFNRDIQQISYDQIPLLDKESAELLGNRKMGSMVDMVSQFEVDDWYSQINYQDQPVRVSPLRYASLIKWFTNQSEGIPAYIKIDMATQNTELVKLDEGMKYTTSDHFNRNIYRHLRFKYPTYIFNDLSFEIDDNGVPYWISPVKK